MPASLETGGLVRAGQRLWGARVPAEYVLHKQEVAALVEQTLHASRVHGPRGSLYKCLRVCTGGSTDSYVKGPVDQRRHRRHSSNIKPHGLTQAKAAQLAGVAQRVDGVEQHSLAVTG